MHGLILGCSARLNVNFEYSSERYLRPKHWCRACKTVIKLIFMLKGELRNSDGPVKKTKTAKSGILSMKYSHAGGL